jgi:hypothetical protein
MCHCRNDLTGLLSGCSVITYFKGTGYEADHQLGGVIAHGKAFVHNHLGFDGPFQVITLAADDDWLGMVQRARFRPTRLMKTAADITTCSGYVDAQEQS